MKKVLDGMNGLFYKGASARGYSPPTRSLIMKISFGILLIAIPFLLITGHLVIAIGWETAIFVWVASTVLATMIVTGISILKDSQ